MEIGFHLGFNPFLIRASIATINIIRCFHFLFSRFNPFLIRASIATLDVQDGYEARGGRWIVSIPS